jgi:uncharacterized protein YdhG (YjbR/CyaY superfamily)
MPKSPYAADPAAVSGYIAKLEASKRDLTEAIRQSILDSDKLIAEHIKWNAPAFFYTGEMKAFDPKEYKRDLIVMNLRQKDHVLLILPTGEIVKDVSTILEGDYSDGRRMIRISDIADLKMKQTKLKKVIKAWIKLID